MFNISGFSATPPVLSGGGFSEFFHPFTLWRIVIIRLPDGSFVRPEYVMMVEALDDIDLPYGGFVAPRVMLRLKDGDRKACETATFDDAVALRDRIGTEASQHKAEMATDETGGTAS